MFQHTSLDPHHAQFQKYLALHTQTIEQTLRRMKLPLPAGMEELPGGIRGCLCADAHLRGTITSQVVEAFIKAVADGVVDPAAAEGWIVKVTRRVTRTCAKTRARQLARYASLHRDDGSTHEELLPCYDTPEARLFGAEEYQRAEELLAMLSEKDQELVRARILDEKPYEELAFSFGSTPAALRQRFTRLMARLREQGEELMRLDLCA